MLYLFKFCIMSVNNFCQLATIPILLIDKKLFVSQRSKVKLCTAVGLCLTVFQKRIRKAKKKMADKGENLFCFQELWRELLKLKCCL